MTTEPLAVAPPVLLVPIQRAADEYHVSPWTIRRWVSDPAMGFPEPVNIANRLYFYRHELSAWNASRSRVSEKPTTMSGLTPPHLRSSRARKAARARAQSTGE